MHQLTHSRFQQQLGVAASVLFACACQTVTTPSNAPPPANASTTQALAAPGSAPGAATPNSPPMTVSQASSQNVGTAMRVTGLYFGWKGPCQGKPPTRSAWQLVESNAPGAACIYVDGPELNGVSPSAPPANLYVVVQATLQVDGQARYLEAQRVEKQ
ncbi:MAG TPA: hypothetical protein VIV60_26140 [Polyangiaceae bacterium]